jgi:hypothetical protein
MIEVTGILYTDGVYCSIVDAALAAAADAEPTARHVCVVSERAIGSARAQWSLYGVFTSEALARADYGEPDSNHKVTFDIVRLFGADAEPTPDVGEEPKPAADAMRVLQSLVKSNVIGLNDDGSVWVFGGLAANGSPVWKRGEQYATADSAFAEIVRRAGSVPVSPPKED